MLTQTSDITTNLHVVFATRNFEEERCDWVIIQFSGRRANFEGVGTNEKIQEKKNDDDSRVVCPADVGAWPARKK